MAVSDKHSCAEHPLQGFTPDLLERLWREIHDPVFRRRMIGPPWRPRRIPRPRRIRLRHRSPLLVVESDQGAEN